MSEKDPQRITPMDDDVTSFVADEARLHTFREASAQLSRFEVPRLVGVADPHERVFYAGPTAQGSGVAGVEGREPALARHRVLA